jgi:cell division initiation protein
MPLSPEDVERQVFKEKIRGYDMEEVDAFLDRVVERMRELEAERDRAAHEVRASVAGAEDTDDADLLRRTLVTAQRAADQTLADARSEADRVLSEARFEAAREREQLQEEAEELGRAVEDLKRFRQDYVERVRTVINDHLRVLQERELPGFPAEGEEIARRVGGGVGTVGHDGPVTEPATRSALDTDDDMDAAGDAG